MSGKADDALRRLGADVYSLVDIHSAAGTPNRGKMIQTVPSTASIPLTRFGPFGFGERQPATKTVSGRVRYGPAVLLILILFVFALLQCLLPLRTAVKIGADEEFELAKATLCLQGYELYTEIWNDQPPLDTFLVTQILKHISPSVFGPRLLSCAFTAILLTAIFLASLRVHGLLTAALTTAWLIASPGFLELSCSVMQEIPALAPAVAALSVLLVGRKTRWHSAEIFAGILFAAALQMKFIGVVYLPLIALILWLRHREAGSALIRPSATLSLGEGKRSVVGSCANNQFIATNLLWSMLLFVTSLAVSFVAIMLLVGGGSYLMQLNQSWAAHFAWAKSFEYGSPSEYPFDWSVLLKNWDTTVPAVLGIILSLSQVRRSPVAIVPLVWLALTLAVFGAHKPWWSYYYVHNAIPLCWCAAIGMAGLWRRMRHQRSVGLGCLLGVFALVGIAWMGARVYLQVTSIRRSPQIYSAVVLTEVGRLKPFTKFMYTDDPVYSFHTGIPLPPKLGVISLKRFWSGDLTNARLAEELEAVKPGILLLKNNSRELPFNELIHAQYRLIYEDADHRLYGHKAVLAKAKQSITNQ